MLHFCWVLYASIAATWVLVSSALEDDYDHPTSQLEKRYPKSEDGRCGVKFGTRCEDDQGCSSEGYVMTLNTV